MRGQSENKLKNMTYTAMAIALVTVSTMVIRIPSPKEGYINFGDIMIFITAALLGKRNGFIAGGIGSAMADILSSYAIYAPGTFLIKGLEGFMFGLLIKKNSEGNINIFTAVIASIISAAWMAAGYFLYECLIYGIGTALPNIPANLLQGGISAAAALPILLAVKKAGFMFKTENR